MDNMYQRGTIFPMRAGYATQKIKFTWPYIYIKKEVYFTDSSPGIRHLQLQNTWFLIFPSLMFA